MSGINNSSSPPVSLLQNVKNWFTALFSYVSRLLSKVRKGALIISIIAIVLAGVSALITIVIKEFFSVPVQTATLNVVIQDEVIVVAAALGVSAVVLISYVVGWAVSWLVRLISSERRKTARNIAVAAAFSAAAEIARVDPAAGVDLVKQIDAATADTTEPLALPSPTNSNGTEENGEVSAHLAEQVDAAKGETTETSAVQNSEQ